LPDSLDKVILVDYYRGILISPDNILKHIKKWGKPPPRFKAYGFSASPSAGDSPRNAPKDK
jgi:hypothetical protein